MSDKSRLEMMRNKLKKNHHTYKNNINTHNNRGVNNSQATNNTINI